MEKATKFLPIKAVSSLSAIHSVFLAQTISLAGDRLFAIALAWWVISKTDVANRGFMLGLLLAASSLPRVLSGPFLGYAIDKFSKRTCMIVADTLRLFIMVALGILINQNALSLPILFVACIPFFALEPLFDAAISASLSSFSESPSMLGQLVALESLIPNLGTVIGALFGSLALAKWGVEGAVWFNVGTFLVSLAFVSTLPLLKSETSHLDEGEGATGGGYAFLRLYPDATRLMVLFALGNFFIVPVFLYLPLLVQDVLKADAAQLGLLELAFAAGSLAIFGYFFVKPRIFRRTRWLRFFMVASSGLFLYILGGTESLEIMLASLAAWGASIAFVSYLATSYFQRIIPDHCKGRFFAMTTSLCSLGFPLSFFSFGYLSSYFPLQDIIFANAACLLLISIAFLSVPDKAES